MKEQIRKILQAHSTNLMDKIDILKMRGAEKSLISLVERVLNVCSISVMNLDNIQKSELESVSQIIRLCNEMLDNDELIGEYSPRLEEVLDRIENLFRSQKLLLDVSNKVSHTI